MLLVKNAIEELAEGAGLCADVTEDTLRLANRIERILITELGADATDTLTVPVFGGVATLPEYVESVIRALWCDRQMDIVKGCHRYWRAETRLNLDPSGQSEQLEDLGDGFPLYRDIAGGAYSLFAVSERNDSDAEIVFAGTDATGRRIDSTVSIDSAAPDRAPQYTLERFRSVDAISKTSTKGYVHVYAYDPATRATLWLGILAPNDTNPSFRRLRTGRTENGFIDLLVELRHIPHSSGNEIYLIRSREAIYHMAMALRAENDDPGAYERCKNRALSAMRKEQRRRRGPSKAKAKTFPRLVRNPFR